MAGISEIQFIIMQFNMILEKNRIVTHSVVIKMQVNIILPWCKTAVKVYGEIIMLKESLSFQIQDFVFHTRNDITY